MEFATNYTHNNDQILIVTKGRGIVSNEKKEKQIAPGGVAVIPASEKHWHGAIPGSAMTHIAISAPQTSIDQVKP
ncbi:hypothetical protein COU91_00275 [Candidatus Saccharibacteria bacterium CG10_big_fil_rev_8_21_14_0_10_47_8]|nr:MAG: hypothetical protein COU91_00275 [Candidatus Saccharibacteria bacterium CG10_big_fil_rev_8_21_14_0_10_47_8]